MKIIFMLKTVARTMVITVGTTTSRVHVKGIHTLKKMRKKETNNNNNNKREEQKKHREIGGVEKKKKTHRQTRSIGSHMDGINNHRYIAATQTLGEGLNFPGGRAIHWKGQGHHGFVFRSSLWVRGQRGRLPGHPHHLKRQCTGRRTQRGGGRGGGGGQPLQI